jgi:hypothetical protein
MMRPGIKELNVEGLIQVMGTYLTSVIYVCNYVKHIVF